MRKSKFHSISVSCYMCPFVIYSDKAAAGDGDGETAADTLERD